MDQLAYEEIDLRVYVRTLLRNWPWIALSTVVCAVAAFAVSQLGSPVYEAAALIAVMDARYSVQLDSRFMTSEEVPEYRVFFDLAVSDDVLQALWLELDEKPETIQSWHDLRESLAAAPAAEKGLLELSVRLSDPEDAARVANAWAEVLVAQANAVFGSPGADLLFVADQLELSQEALDSAEAAVVRFQSTNEISIRQNQLAARLDTQKQYLGQLRETDNLTRDIRDLRAQMDSQPLNTQVTFGDSLTALSLQVRSFNAQASVPIELQITSPEALSDVTLEGQVAVLDELLATLTVRASDVEAEITLLEPEILALQHDLAQERAEERRLTQTQDLARETYTMLSRKLAESRIEAAGEQSQVVLASYAGVPVKPASTTVLMATAIGAAVGGLLSTVSVFVLEWWRQGEEAT